MTTSISDLQQFKTTNEFTRTSAKIRGNLNVLFSELNDTLLRHLDNLNLQSDLMFQQFQDFSTGINNIYEVDSTKFQGASSRLFAGLLRKYSEDWINLVNDYNANATTILHHNVSQYKRYHASLVRTVHNSKESLFFLLSLN